jgi:subtilisin-like proprotein convertase family protein
MKSKLAERVARVAHFLRHRPAPRPGGRPRFCPALEVLEDRRVLSTVFTATDVPQRVDFPDVFTTSFVDVPQSLTIASLKVQLNITYPLDNDLTIDLIAPDGTDVPLTYFDGAGANFQNTIFDDAAATPIWAGNSPFAGSYHPEGSLSALAGTNAQGTWQLQIIDWGASSGTLNSWSLIVDSVGSVGGPATASSLAVGGFPSSTTAGAPGSFTVTARDAAGNVATGYRGTVHFTSSDPQAALPADYTFTAADAGSHTFNTTLKTAGMQTLTATDTAAAGLTGIEAGILVSPATASRLAVSAPAGATAGAAFNVRVIAQDAYGNTAASYAGTVHLTSSDGQAVLPADASLSNGTGTFTVTLKTAGSESVTATDTVWGTVTGSAPVSVRPAAADHLVFGQQPTATATGATISPAVTVRVLDAYNNVLTGDYTDMVTLTLGANPGGATLQGTTTAPVNGGIATFSNLALTLPGNGYTLVASSGSLPVATSASFAVTTSTAIVGRSTDLPQSLTPVVIIFSYIYIPQNVTIASVKVQLNITFPLDSQLAITLLAPAAMPVPPHVQLSTFEGAGANFQNTTFDDAAATSIRAGASPFAGSYRPEVPLATLAGMNAQGYWTLGVANYGGSTGTVNSWSLIIQPAGSLNALSTAGTAKVATGAPAAPAAAPQLATALSSFRSLVPTDPVAFAAPTTVAGTALAPVTFSASVGAADTIPEPTAFNKPVQSLHAVRPHVPNDGAFENFPSDEGS